MKRLFLAMIMLSCTNLFALTPNREYEILPEDYGMNYEEMTVKTEDGIDLFAWNFKPMKTSFKTIIVSHNAEGNMADNIEIIAQFLSLGYNVVSYDYRGYGKSSDFRISDKFFIYAQFAQDLDAVIRHVKKYNAKQEVSLYGIGVGAGLSVSVGSNNLKVSKIIADAPYNNLEFTQKRIEEVTGVKKLMPLGFDKNFVEPTFALQEKGEHIDKFFYIVGQADQLVTVEDVRELQRFKRKNSFIYVVPGATNDKNFSTNKNEYFSQIKTFLEE